MSWEIIGSHIAIIENGKRAHLEAEDVYRAFKDGGFALNGIEQGKLEDAFPNITWSPIGKDANIIIDYNESLPQISIAIGEKTLDVVSGKVLDQIIIDDVWYFVANAEEINKIIADLEVDACGHIGIGDYIKLKRSGADDLIIDNYQGKTLQIDSDYLKPKYLNADMYEYQKRGYLWLDYMLKNCGGCILGDEMGLGKTLQAIALIQQRANEGKKSLVVAPVSLLDNWQNECKKFAPQISVLIHHGYNRTGSPMVFANYDLVVTSYGHVVTDNVLFSMQKWDLLILDEAQNIKNPNSARTKSVKNVLANERLAVTGTPFENHVLDVWSLLDFIIPENFGNQSDFKSTVSDDVYGAKLLEPILSSVMIRRLVRDVAQDLPEKVVIAQPLTMLDNEVDGYEGVRHDLQGVENATLPMLQKLRMYCTHPMIEDDAFGDPYSSSMKYQRTCEIIEEILSRNEKVIVFTSYQKMFDIFLNDLPRRFSVNVDYINGSTEVGNRQGIVDKFNQTEGGAILILNPRAAGTGLNITAANHVIHYNPEWNPALEDQASARAYRRGQKKTTFIYRLYYKDTVEEIINQRLDRKREMAEHAVIGADGTEADMKDIVDAINISPRRTIL